MQDIPISAGSAAIATSTPGNAVAGTGAAAAAASSSTTDPKQVARDFEALLIQNLLRTMRESSIGDMSNEQSVYYGMFDEKIAEEIARSGRLGLADQIARSLPGGEAELSHSVNNPDRLVFAEQLWRSRQNQSTNQLNPPARAVDSAEADAGTIRQRQRQFLESIAPLARSEGKRGGIDPLPIMAIAALETGWGEHMISTDEGQTSHNYFGIKQHAAAGRGIAHATTEYVDDRPMTVRDDFRRYASMSDSVSDFVDFLHENPRYRSALSSGNDPERFVHELQSAGYATDPAYAQKVLGVMAQIRRIGDS